MISTKKHLHLIIFLFLLYVFPEFLFFNLNAECMQRQNTDPIEDSLVSYVPVNQINASSPWYTRWISCNCWTGANKTAEIFLVDPEFSRIELNANSIIQSFQRESDNVVRFMGQFDNNLNLRHENAVLRAQYERNAWVIEETFKAINRMEERWAERWANNEYQLAELNYYHSALHIEITSLRNGVDEMKSHLQIFNSDRNDFDPMRVKIIAENMSNKSAQITKQFKIVDNLNGAIREFKMND